MTLPTRYRKGGVARIVRDTYGDGWEEIRQQVLRRDKFCCTSCGCSVRGDPTRDIHHIIPLSRGGRTILSNLTTLCGSCHEGKHAHMKAKATATPIRQDSGSAFVTPYDRSNPPKAPVKRKFFKRSAW